MSSINLGIFANDQVLEKTKAFSAFPIPFTENSKETVVTGPISSSEELRHKFRGGFATEDTRILPQNFKAQRHEPDEGNYPHEQSIEYIKCKNPNTTGNIYKIVTTQDISSENIQNSPYCMKDVIKDVMLLKSEFDELQDKEFIDARYRANPYEKIGKSIFTNRAAIKMANIDKVTRITDVTRLEEEKNILYFADVCAGPGGFTEFIYYKYKTEMAKGFGFTLKGKEDWKLDKFNAESPHDNMEIYYGVDDTGDICVNENIMGLSDVIDKGTDGRGVSLMLADGGFSVQGVENQQEGLTKQLVLCQIIAALTCCRKGGNFTVKVFDLYTNFSVSMCYILFQNFEQFGIFKPLSSRPANSERYIVCKGLRARKPVIVKYLMEINTKLANKQNITSIVDPEIMQADEEFMDYILSSNILIGKKQIKFLQKIKRCVEDPFLDSKKYQQDLRKRCLEHWGLPHNTGTQQPKYQNKNPSIPFGDRGERRDREPRREKKREPHPFQKPVQYVVAQTKVKEETFAPSKEEQAEMIRAKYNNTIDGWRSGQKGDDNQDEDNVDLEKAWNE